MSKPRGKQQAELQPVRPQRAVRFRHLGRPSKGCNICIKPCKDNRRFPKPLDPDFQGILYVQPATLRAKLCTFLRQSSSQKSTLVQVWGWKWEKTGTWCPHAVGRCQFLPRTVCFWIKGFVEVSCAGLAAITETAGGSRGGSPGE